MDEHELDVFGTILLTGSNDGPRRFGRGRVAIRHGASIDGTPWTQVDLVSADGVTFASLSLMGDERRLLASHITQQRGT